MGLSSLFKKKEVQTSTDPFEKLRSLRIFNGNRGIPVDTYVAPISVLDSIIFPNIELTDIWEKQAFNKHVANLAESLGGRYFDICPVDKLLNLFAIKQYYSERPLNAEAEEAMRKLNLIHCVHYDKMYKEVMIEIPTLINTAFKSPSKHPNAGKVFVQPTTLSIK